MTIRYGHIKTIIGLLFISLVSSSIVVAGTFWPPAPERARFEYVGEIDCSKLSPGGGLFKKVARLIGGSSPEDELSLPFDLRVTSNRLYLVCQNIPALIEIDRKDNSFKLHQSNKSPLSYPISVCDGGDGIVFVTDTETRIVYRFKDGVLEPFIVANLTRPTGIAAIPSMQLLFVVDTGEHSLKIFDYEGSLLKSIDRLNDTTRLFNYPTFVTATADGTVLVNDALNYSIKQFDAKGNFAGEFGSEGDAPGTFSRPKGIAVDSDSHIYVVDNLFDNFQVFDQSGQILLAVGSAGQEPGQFWSPAGIDIKNDTIFIADTFNNRIQILHYLGDEE